jgi:hypothetical protein
MTPEILAAVIGTALVVLLLVVGALRLAAAYRRARRVARRWARTRLVLTQTTRRRKGARRG